MILILVCLRLNVLVNNFSVMLGRSHRSLGITSTFGGKYVLLRDTTRRPESGSNPRPLDPESEVLTTRPARPLNLGNDINTKDYLGDAPFGFCINNVDKMLTDDKKGSCLLSTE